MHYTAKVSFPQLIADIEVEPRDAALAQMMVVPIAISSHEPEYHDQLIAHSFVGSANYNSRWQHTVMISLWSTMLLSGDILYD